MNAQYRGRLKRSAFGAAVDFEFFVMLVGFVAPDAGSPLSWRRPSKSLAKYRSKSRKKASMPTTSVSAIPRSPRYSCTQLSSAVFEIAQTYVQGLEGLEELVRHGADWCNADFFGQINIAGTAHNVGSGF